MTTRLELNTGDTAHYKKNTLLLLLILFEDVTISERGKHIKPHNLIYYSPLFRNFRSYLRHVLYFLAFSL